MIEIDGWLLVATIIAFLFMISILNKIFYKPILSYMYQREHNMFMDSETTRRNEKAILSYEEKINERLAQTRSEASLLKQEAYDRFKAENDKIYDATKLELENDFAKHKQELELQKQNLEANLKNDLPKFRQSLQNTLSKI